MELTETMVGKLMQVSELLKNESIELSDWLEDPFNQTYVGESETAREMLNFYAGYFQGVSDATGEDAFAACVAEREERRLTALHGRPF
jgi:hypothetical protein